MEGQRLQGKPGGAGPQRVLEEDSSLGTVVQDDRPVCAMRARPAADCGRGPWFVSSPSVPTVCRLGAGVCA